MKSLVYLVTYDTKGDYDVQQTLVFEASFSWSETDSDMSESFAEIEKNNSNYIDIFNNRNEKLCLSWQRQVYSCHGTSENNLETTSFQIIIA